MWAKVSNFVVGMIAGIALTLFVEYVIFQALLGIHIS